MDSDLQNSFCFGPSTERYRSFALRVLLRSDLRFLISIALLFRHADLAYA